MARDWFINGPAMVTVKGSSSSAIANLTQLGLSDAPIRVTPNFRHKEINVDAWGEAPAEMQFMLATVNIGMTLIHFDRDVLAECLAESMGGTAGGVAEGTLTGAGSRLGNNAARFTATNHYIGLNIASPTAASPWRFLFTFLTGPPMEFPLGVEKSIVTLNWLCIPYTTDPWGTNDGGAGQGAAGKVLFDHTADT